MPTLTEKAIRVDASDKKAGLGLDKLETKSAEEKVGSEKENKEGKVKNQAEIDRVRIENVRIKEEREKVRRTVDEALELTRRTLKKKGLPEEEKARLRRSLRTIEDAKRKSLDNDRQSYKVNDKSGGSIKEGVNVEELFLTIRNNVRAEKEKIAQVVHKQELWEESAKAKSLYTLSLVKGKESTQEDHKHAWYKALEKLPKDGSLAREAHELMAKWEQDDREEYHKNEKWQGYEDTQRQSQLGEALRQLTEEHEKEDETKFRKQLQLHKEGLANLERLQKELLVNSSEYSKYNRNMGASAEREATEIAKDSDYRKFLEHRFKALKRLGKDFDNLGKEGQDRKLAALALEQRIVLELPKYKKAPEPVFEAPSSPVTSAQHTGTRTARAVNVPLGPMHEPVERPVSSLREKNLPITSSVEVPSSIEIKGVLIDVSEVVRRMARTISDEKVRKELAQKEMGRFKRIKLAFAGLTENAKRIQYYNSALKEIHFDNNLMKAIQARASGAPATPDMRSNYELLDSVIKECNNEVLIQKEIGEKISEDPVVKTQVADLLYRHANNQWKDLAGLDPKFATATGREAIDLFVKYRIAELYKSSEWSKNGEFNKHAKGDMYASNFSEIAEVYKDYIKSETDKVVVAEGKENKEAILQHIQGMMHLDMQLGLKERDLVNNKPKNILRGYEKVLNWTESHKIFGYIISNPVVYSVLAGGAGAEIAVKTGARWAVVGGAQVFGYANFWIPLGAGAMVGGAMRYAKRSKDIKHDLGEELRHEALGGKGSEILDKAGRYETVKFSHAFSSVEALLSKDSLTDDDKKELSKIVARLQMREAVGGKNMLGNQLRRDNVDLFVLNSEEGIKYGSSLVAEAKLKTAIGDVLKKNSLQEADLEPWALAQRQQLIVMMEKVDSQQGWFRRREAAKSAVSGAIMGAAAGLIGQKLAYFVGAKLEAVGGKSMEKLIGQDFLAYFKTHNSTLDKIWDNWQGAATPHEVLIDTTTNVSINPASSEYWQHHGAALKPLHSHGFDLHHNPLYDESDRQRFTGKELQTQFLLDKIGQVIVSTKGIVNNVKANMLGKVGSWGENSDKTVDNRFSDLVKSFAQKVGSGSMANKDFANFGEHFHERLHFRIYPTAELSHKGIGIDLGAADSKGNFNIPKDLQSQFFDSRGHLHAGMVASVEFVDDSGVSHGLSSIKGTGDPLSGFETITQTTRFTAEAPAPKDYDNPIVLTPPGRKVYLRPEERKEVEDKKKQEAAEKEKKKKDKAKLHGNHGEDGNDSHAGITEASQAERKLKEENPKRFNIKEVKSKLLTFQKYFTHDKQVEADVNLEVISAYWDAENKVQNAYKAVLKNILKVQAEKKAKNAPKPKKDAHDEVHAPKEDVFDLEKMSPVYLLHTEGPTIQEYMAEMDKLEASAGMLEKKFDRIEDLDKRIRKIDAGEEPESMSDRKPAMKKEFKELTGKNWTKEFKLADYKKDLAKRVDEEDGSLDVVEPNEDPDNGDADLVEGPRIETADKGLESELKAFSEKHKGIKLDIGKDWNASLNAKKDGIKNIDKIFDILEKDPNFKPGNITVVVKASKFPIKIGDKVWELPSACKIYEVKKAFEAKKKIPTPKTLTQNEEDWSPERKAALLAFERVKNWNSLNPKNEENRERNFELALKNIKKNFTVEGKKFRKELSADLDGKASLDLFRRAHVNVQNIKYVPSGQHIENSINIDTGDQEGFVVTYSGMEKGEPYKGQPLTVYFDHHADESKRGSSATKYVYENLKKWGLLKEDPFLDKVVEFVNHEDNRSYPNEQKYYKDSPYTMLGLGRKVEPETLYQFFRDELSPTQKLTTQQLGKYGLTEASEQQKKIVEKTEPMWKELEQNGFVVDSKDYGKILVDIGGVFNRTAGGFVGAKAMGAGSYILWSPKTQSFFISSVDKPFSQDFLPQGSRKRETMWVKDKPGHLEMNLREIIKTMSGRDFRMGLQMTAALETAEKENKARV